MSKKLDAMITCPNCHKQFKMSLYRSIWGEYPENRELVMNDEINVAHCPHCKTSTKLQFPLLYTNSNKKIAVWWEPVWDESVERDVRAYKMALPNSHLARAPRVRDWETFKQTIQEMENISSKDSQGAQQLDFNRETFKKALRLTNTKTKKPTWQFNQPYHFWLVFEIIFLLVALFAGKLSYDFYMMLKIIVCGINVYVARICYKNNNALAWIFGIMAFVFNPIIPLKLGADAWRWVNGISILLGLYMLYEERLVKESVATKKENIEKVFSENKLHSEDEHIANRIQKECLVERPEESKTFLEMRTIAGNHIQNKMKNGYKWLRWQLTSPSFDDMNFSYKDSIFSVLIVPVRDGKFIPDEKKKELFFKTTKENNLIPCFFPIDSKTKKLLHPKGWNLCDPKTRKVINPEKIAHNKKIKMSTWELNYFAIDIVKNDLKKNGFKIDSFCDLPGIMPQVWFQDKEGNHCWIEVSYTLGDPKSLHSSLENKLTFLPSLKRHPGYFAAVGLCPMEKDAYRGSGFYVNYTGIQAL